MKQFTIDERCITDVVQHTWYVSPSDPTPEQLFDLIRRENSSVISSVDHPVFTELRNQLENEGYITTERHWWNGDRVIKQFKLNEWVFRKGDKFLCASAMKTSISVARKNNYTTLSRF